MRAAALCVLLALPALAQQTAPARAEMLVLAW